MLPTSAISYQDGYLRYFFHKALTGSQTHSCSASALRAKQLSSDRICGYLSYRCACVPNRRYLS